MKINKILTITLFIIFSSLTSITYAETLKFGSSTYEGDTKKDKAHGVGIFTFADGSKYEGKFRKNKMHGKGKYTDVNGKIFEGKWRNGKLKVKIDRKTREIIVLSFSTGKSSYFEIKGKGKVASKWFEAEKNSSGAYTFTDKGERDMAKATVEAQSGEGADGGGSGSGGSGC